LTENEITNKIIGLSIEIHKALGPGLLKRIKHIQKFKKQTGIH
jgi:hypothetical protein